MDDLLTKLYALFGIKPAQAPTPMPATTPEIKPWDSPVLTPALQNLSPQSLNQSGISPTSPGAITPSDDALIQALLKRRLNQEFSRAGGQPVPQ